MTSDRARTPSTFRRTVGTLVRVVLIGLAIYALWRWVDWPRVWGALSSMSPVALVIAVALASADRVLMGFKWRQLVRAAGGTLRLRDATNIYYQTCFTDLVFPNVVASEGLRVYLGRRLGLPLSLLLGSMAIERMIAAAVAIVLASAGLLYLAAEVEPQNAPGLPRDHRGDRRDRRARVARAVVDAAASRRGACAARESLAQDLPAPQENLRGAGRVSWTAGDARVQSGARDCGESAADRELLRDRPRARNSGSVSSILSRRSR